MCARDIVHARPNAHQKSGGPWVRASPCMHAQWFLHGLILDIIIIGVLPVISGEKTASAMFYNSKLANLAPQVQDQPSNSKPTIGLDMFVMTCCLLRCPPIARPQHRRFIAENTAYAVMRIAPIFFTDNLPVLLITVRT